MRTQSTLPLLFAVAAAGAIPALAGTDDWSHFAPAFCYGPFQGEQSPETQTFPTDEQVLADLEILNDLCATIRTYGVDPDTVMQRIPAHADTRGLTIYPGCWIDNQSWDQTQIDSLIAVGNSGLANIEGLVVGNEFLYRHPASAATLIARVNEVRDATGQPTGASEQWHVWRDHPALAAACDFVFVHIHPYWEEQQIAAAVTHVAGKYALMQQLFPGKRIVISETGWPSAGNPFGAAVPSLANHQRFIREFTAWAKGNEVEYFLFEAFDEPWKGKYGVAERSWGLMDEHRHDKGAIAELLAGRLGIGIVNPGAGRRVEVDLFAKYPHTLHVSRNLLTWDSFPSQAPGHDRSWSLSDPPLDAYAGGPTLFFKATAAAP